MRTKVDEWIEIINSQPIPKKWDNTSWLNDGCPSFIYKNLQIWVDHEDVNNREYEGTKRYGVEILDDDLCLPDETERRFLLSTDDFNELLKFVNDWEVSK